MAHFHVSSVLVGLVIFSASFQISTPYSYAGAYGDSKGKQELDIQFIPLREKRYVAEPIQRLKEENLRGYTSKDLQKDDISPKHRAEFIGSLAVNGIEETNVGGHSSVSVPVPQSEPVAINVTTLPPMESSTSNPNNSTTPVPEKPTKKPVDKFTKKPSDSDKTTPKTAGSSAKDDVDVDSYPKDLTNNTFIRNNITERKEDDHLYYTSVFMSGEGVARHYWVNLPHEQGVTVHEMLSKSHRKAATVRLSFDFLFYGHIVRNITVATGGFLYTGDYIHSWLAATQYIAPLMANFDTSISEDSIIKYRDNGTSFTVEWSNVFLQDDKGAGKYTFQVSLHNNGDIVFVYKDIPMLVEHIADILHPVKVGLSDAYIIDKNVVYIRKKTIYEYHRVSFNREEIKNWTVIYMKALPTCVTLKDCFSCSNHNTTFSCRWCERIQRCSSGFDRFLQEWSQNRCPETATSERSYCTKSNYQRDEIQPPSVEAQSKVDSSRETRLGHSGMVGFLIVGCFIACIGLWVFHAYRNPHTRFGQVLIKYRPSQWRLRRGEARYTAATIHM